jgi:shikimate dehydrogenase
MGAAAPGLEERYALMGHPVSHSWSPFIHGMFARQLGHRLQYRLVDVPPERFRAQAIQFFLDGGKGLNVTVPHKQAAAELVNELTARAARARAVNTIAQPEPNELVGDNTDGAGLIADLVMNLSLSLNGMSILILGAGGATRGVMEPLLAARPARVVIANRTPERAVDLALEFETVGRAHGCGFAGIPDGPYELILNATSASLQGEVPPVDDRHYSPGTVVYDMAYSKGETPFTRHAIALGCTRVYRGWGMLVEQAAEAYLLWHGVRPQTKQVLELLTAASGAQP